MRCIFCQGPLRGQESSEHVLLNALGGKVKTRKLSCAPCNNRFGGTIDRELAEQFASVRNMFEMVSGDDRDAPSLLKIQAGDRKVNLLGNGHITLAGKPFTIEETGEGRFKVQLNLQNLDELERFIPHIMARTGISEERLREQIAGAQFTDTQERPGVVTFRFSFGGEEAMRAVAKACLLLWGRKLGNAETQRPQYDETRRFIQNGGADFLGTRTFLDSRPLPNAAEIGAAYGPLFNMLYVASDVSGRVVGHFTIYNLIGFQVVLAERDGVASETASLANNPLNPKLWSDKLSDIPALTSAWLEERRDEPEEYQRRFAHMMKIYYDIMGKRAQMRIIERVFARYGLQDDSPISQELLPSIAKEIGTRLAYNALGLAVTIPVQPEIIARRMGPSSEK